MPGITPSTLMRLEEPEKKRVKDILAYIENDDLGIPEFQREFEWRRSNVTDLLVSMLRGYYIGSLLFWSIDRTTDMAFGPIYGTRLPTNPRYLILDGQQRVSALYYVIKAPNIPLWGMKKPIRFFIDIKEMLKLDGKAKVEDEKLVVSYTDDEITRKNLNDKQNQFATRTFPLKELETVSRWCYDFEAFLKTVEHSTPENANKLSDSVSKHLEFLLKDFEIPIIKLPSEISIGNVAKIFEKLNTMGLDLTTFDLLNARMIKHNIKPRELWKTSARNNALIKEFSEGNDRFPLYIVQTLALKRGKPVKSDELLDLSSRKFETDWTAAVGDTESMLKMLKETRSVNDGFGVLTRNLVPFRQSLPILAALFSKAKGRARAEMNKKIIKWYWSAIITHAYAGSTDTQTYIDYNAVNRWFTDNSSLPQVVIEAKANLANPNVITLEQLVTGSDALYKGILCLIALKGGRDFVQNTITTFNTIDAHHIFPESRAREFGASDDQINSILNMTLLDADTNRNYIRAKKPSQYINEIMREFGLTERQMRDRLETHLISSSAFDALLNDDFTTFITERKRTVIAAFLSILT